MKFGFSRQIFEKYLNIKFHENLSSGTELFHADGRMDRQTEGHDQAKVAFRNFANVSKKTELNRT
jgi:hypothetical protein